MSAINFERLFGFDEGIRTVQSIPNTRLRKTDQTEDDCLVYGAPIKPFQGRESPRLLLAGHD